MEEALDLLKYYAEGYNSIETGNTKTVTKLINTICQALSNNQSKLDKIEEWIYNELGRNDISSCVPVSEDLNPYHCTKLRELLEILKKDSYET